MRRHYSERENCIKKVLDFVQFGGPELIVGGTILEIWPGRVVILDTTILAGSSIL